MPGLGPRLIVAAYAILVLGLLLWQALRGMARVRAVVDYIDLREREYPAVKGMSAKPLARSATLPPTTAAFIAAGCASVPLVTAIAVGGSIDWQLAVTVVTLLGAIVVAVVSRRSPWAETRSIVWSAAIAGGEMREDMLRHAMTSDPQVAQLAAEQRVAEDRS